MAIEVYNGGECDFNDDKTVLNIEGEAWSRWRRQKLEMKMVKEGIHESLWNLHF
jgi:hypothetical protein